MAAALNATGRPIAFSCVWPLYDKGLPPRVSFVVSFRCHPIISGVASLHLLLSVLYYLGSEMGWSAPQTYLSQLKVPHIHNLVNPILQTREL